jgi:uncharacterized protein YjbK
MASGHQEIELKRLLVGEGAGDRLIAALDARVRRETHQVNHVFDTDDRRLDRGRYAVRLRRENGSAFLTVKGPGRRVGASTDTKTEAEVPVEPNVADGIVAGRVDPVAALMSRLPDPAYQDLWSGVEDARQGRQLDRVGSFENVRRTVPVALPSGLTVDVEVDRTRFPDGRVDEEVEIELPTEAVAGEVEAWLAAVASAASVTTRPSSPKIVRFLAALRGAER